MSKIINFEKKEKSKEKFNITVKFKDGTEETFDAWGFDFMENAPFICVVINPAEAELNEDICFIPVEVIKSIRSVAYTIYPERSEELRH